MPVVYGVHIACISRIPQTGIHGGQREGGAGVIESHNALFFINGTLPLALPAVTILEIKLFILRWVFSSRLESVWFVQNQY